MDKTQLDAIKARRTALFDDRWFAQITPGWEQNECIQYEIVADPGDAETCIACRINDYDANFIAHAPADIDYLLGCIAELEAEIRRRDLPPNRTDASVNLYSIDVESGNQ